MIVDGSMKKVMIRSSQESSSQCLLSATLLLLPGREHLFDGLSNLAANPVYPLRLSDQNVAQSDNGGRFASIQTGKLNHMNCNGHTTWWFRT